MITIKNKKIRDILRFTIPFIVIPLIVIFGAFLVNGKNSLLVSFLVAMAAVVLFIAGFEKRKTGTRRMVIVSVMTALCIVGRFIPFFKPVTALTVLTSVYFGGEAGFLVGAMSAVLSNFYFGQGPWTPFQMLAWGIIGYVAGLLGKYLEKNRILLLIYGVLSGIVFSFIMDVWAVMWYNNEFSITLYIAALGTALPYTILYAVSNFIFLFFMAKPFGDKFLRIKTKYGV